MAGDMDTVKVNFMGQLDWATFKIFGQTLSWVRVFLDEIKCELVE